MPFTPPSQSPVHPAWRPRRGGGTDEVTRSTVKLALRCVDVGRGPLAGARLVTLSGEIDACNSGWLTAELIALIGDIATGRAPGKAELSGVVVDLTCIRFCDAGGIAALVKAFKHARGRHLGLELAGARGRVERVLRVTGIDAVLTLHPELEGALTALAAHR